MAEHIFRTGGMTHCGLNPQNIKSPVWRRDWLVGFPYPAGCKTCVRKEQRLRELELHAAVTALARLGVDAESLLTTIRRRS